MLDFVKGKLEEGEGVSREALDRILVAAESARPACPQAPLARWHARPFLLAASLAVAVCGLLVAIHSSSVRREGDLANVLALLREADGDSPSGADSLADNLLAWQDAPMRVDEAD